MRASAPSRIADLGSLRSEWQQSPRCCHWAYFGQRPQTDEAVIAFTVGRRALVLKGF